MLSISQVADAYSWLYATAPAPEGFWAHVLPTDGAYAAVLKQDGISYVMFRGSTTFVDWIEDFTRVSEPLQDPQLGSVHWGFAVGVAAVQAQLDAMVDNSEVVVVGHSLGAGHAALYAARRVANGHPVNRIIMFGEPRPGGARLAEVLAPVPIWSFRNKDGHGQDLVTDVPFAVPPLLDYRHPRELTDVCAPPLAGDSWGPFRYHHFFLYCQALGASAAAERLKK